MFFFLIRKVKFGYVLLYEWFCVIYVVFKMVDVGICFCDVSNVYVFNFC